MSAKDQPDNATLLLKELKIPGRTAQPVSENPTVWGINRAAALDNFPRQGLLCQAGPWAPMNPRDGLVGYKNNTLEILRETVDEDHVNTELQMFIAARHITEGTYTLSYSVTRLGQVPEKSEEMLVLVKLTRPGGEDHSEDPGHPDLVMTIPEEILKGGIDKDNVDDGVPITIGNADGQPPYPFAAAGDVIRFSWGGVFVLSAALTQAQADGTEAIIVKIDADTIRKAGDSDDSGLAVVFEVYDLVDNRSSDWSVEQRVLVAVDKTRLVAPLLKEALNNVLDVDKLGDADGTAQVWVSGSSFKVGDIPILTIKGTPQEGPPVDIEVPGEALVSVPTTHETKIANSLLRQLAKSQIALSYRLQKADGSADLPAKTRFISVIGEVQRLEAPKALDAKQGAIDPLDPELKQVRIEIPFDAAFLPGQTIKLFWLGTRPDLDTYLPTLPLRPITQGDYDAKEPLLILVDKKHLTPIIGGKLELYYQLFIEDSLFNQMDRFNKTRAIRESKHADILQIGEPRKELPQPTVEGVVDGVLPPDTNGTHLIVGYLKTVDKDVLIYQWEGSKTGVDSDSLQLSEFTAGQPVPFTIKADLIKGNEGGTVKASYELKRAAGGTSYSDTLEFSVGVALDLKEPKIKEAPNDTSLDPLDAQNALTAVIDYAGMLVGDKIIVRWVGAPGTLPAGSDTTEPWPVTSIGPQEIPLAVSVLAFNLAKSITLNYSVTRGTQDPKDSRTRTLAVLQLRVDLSHSPKIIQAAGGGDGTELDVSMLTAAATLRGGFWPHIADGQRVWMRVEGTKKDGTEYKRVVWTGSGNAVNALWMSQRYLDASLSLADLQSLEDLSPLNVFFMATPDRSTDENLALSFPVRTYTVKAAEDAVQVKFTNAPYVIAPKGRLKDIEVQLSNLDGTPVQGLVTLDLPADFSFSDGESGTRDFPSDSEGKVSIRGVTGAQTSGSYTLIASIGASVDEASTTVTAQGQLKNIPIGGGSWDVKISADGTRIYVSSWQKKNLSIIDTATHQIIKTIENITGAHGIALSPDERFCYVSNRSLDKVSVIDLFSEEVIRIIDTGGEPTGLILSLDGQWLFSCNYSSGTVTQFNTETFEVKSITAGRNPRYGFASRDGKSIYICNQASSELSIIDIEKLTRRSMQLPTKAQSITLTHRGDLAYVATASSIAVIDIKQEKIVSHIEGTGGQALTTNKADDFLYITNISEDILRTINVVTGAAGPSYAVGSAPRHLVSSKDGRSMYVCNYGSNYLSWVEL
jgi:YVTN family beta-propeller protein